MRVVFVRLFLRSHFIDITKSLSVVADINNNCSLLAKRCMKANVGDLSDTVYKKQTKLSQIMQMK